MEQQGLRRRRAKNLAASKNLPAASSKPPSPAVTTPKQTRTPEQHQRCMEQQKLRRAQQQQQQQYPQDLSLEQLNVLRELQLGQLQLSKMADNEIEKQIMLEETKNQGAVLEVYRQHAMSNVRQNTGLERQSDGLERQSVAFIDSAKVDFTCANDLERSEVRHHEQQLAHRQKLQQMREASAAKVNANANSKPAAANGALSYPHFSTCAP